jgi:acetylornithine deacetylase/succinyl-diaminopimelate desuccinylase-like protein
MYTHLYTLSAPKMQEQVVRLLEQSGMSISFLTDDRSLFAGELQVGARETLLFSLYMPGSSTTTASSIATVLVAYQAALDACLHVFDSLPINIKWVFDGRVGLQGGATGASTRYGDVLHADRCVQYLPEQKMVSLKNALPLLALGTKGSLRVELMVQTTNIPIEAQYGAIAPNAAWQLLWALNTLKERRENILIEGFYDAVLPVEDDVIEALTRLVHHAPSLSTQWGLQEAFLGLQGLQQYVAYFLTPGCTVSAIHSGSIEDNQQAFLPQTARALLDFQLVPQQDPFDIYSKFQNHLLHQNYTTIQIRLLDAIHPSYTPLSDPFITFAIQATTAAYGQSPQILPLVPADSSFHLLPELALPTVIVPLPFVVTELQELSHSFYQESLIQHIKQATLLIAGSASTEKYSAKSSNI